MSAPKKIKLTDDVVVNKAPQKKGTEFTVVENPDDKSQVSIQDANLLIAMKRAVAVEVKDDEEKKDKK